MADRIWIVVADDHPVVRDGVRSMLAAVPDFEVAGEAASGPEAVAQVGATDPDVVVMDLRMPGGGGVAAVRAVGVGAEELRMTVIPRLTRAEFATSTARVVELREHS